MGVFVLHSLEAQERASQRTQRPGGAGKRCTIGRCGYRPEEDPADGTQLQVKKWAAQNEAEQVGGTRFRMRELWAVVRCASWPTISQIWPWCGAPRCFNSKLRPEYRTGLQS